MYLKNFLLVLFIFGFAFNLHAQDTTKRWSLKDCLSYAKAHNISLQQSQTDVQIAKDQQLAAKGQLLPAINGSVSQNYNIGLNIDPITNQKKNQTTRSNNVGLGASMTLFNGFYVFNGIKKAGQDLLAAKYQYQQQQHRLTIQIINGYLQILLNAEMLHASNRQIELSKQFYKEVKIQLAVGEKSKADFANAAAQLAEDRQQKILSENNLKIARRNLAQALQLQNIENFRIVFQIPAIVDTTLSRQPISHIYEQALQNYPAVQQGEAKVKSAKLNWRMTKSNLWPSIGFSAGLNSLYSDHYLDNNGHAIPFNRQLKDNLGHYFSFNMDIPIFNKLYYRSAIHTAKKGIKKAQLQLKQNTADLHQALQTIYSNVKLYKQAYHAAKDATAALEKALNYAQISYHSGNATYYIYLQARNRYLNAQSTLIQNKYRYLYNAILLNYYFSSDF